MIKEAYCSFEVAKLLKEKGFHDPCIATYNSTTKNFRIEEIYEDWTIHWKDYISAPTHQMAMAWLREQYDLHIIAFPYKANDKKKWCCQVYKTFNLLGCGKYINDTLDSYEEAVEAALKYCIENLI